MQDKVKLHEKEIAKDEMSSSRQLIVTIPPICDGNIDNVVEHMRELGRKSIAEGKISSIAAAKMFIERSEPIPDNPTPLSDESFLLSAKQQIAMYDQCLSSIPPDFLATAKKLANHALIVGSILEHLRNRKLHLKKVSTGSKIHRAASEGGFSKKGKISPSTQNLLKKMDELVAKGFSVTRAADIAFVKYNLGTSSENNRSRYRSHRPQSKKSGDLRSKPPAK